MPPTCLLSFARFALSITFNGDSEGEGSVINLSIKGCKVESDAGVKVGDAMSLILLLPGGGCSDACRFGPGAVGSRSCFGLEFVSLGTMAMHRLRTFLASAAGSKQ